ncbi:MAG: hypothetical protein R6V04_03290 [bacterium]
MNIGNKCTNILLVLLILIICKQNVGVAQENAENEIRATFLKFQKGVEQGETDTGPQLTTEQFSSSFIPFYNQLANVYSKAKIPFPVEISHLKILRDGRAKVETRINPGKDLFVFTLKKKDKVWKFCHLECILFPIHSVPSMPYKDTYDIPHEKRGFMMAELNLHRKSSTYEVIKNLSDEQTAKNFFLDGPGYKAALDAWLPFIEGAAQFALFFAITENNYWGAHYIVTKADFENAEVVCSPLIELDVLQRSYHYPKFSIEE